MLRRVTAMLAPAMMLLVLAACDGDTETAARTDPVFGEFGFDTAGMDRSVQPGQDWFSYASGEWRRTTEIPADRSNYNAFTFLTLQAQYRASPNEYLFRRRLETLEATLASRRFTILDVRVQRDGGELWITP